MLSIEEIKDLIRTLDESSLDELIYQNDTNKLKLKKNAQPFNKRDAVANTSGPEPSVVSDVVLEEAVQTNKEEIETNAPNYDYEITSPMVGTFYLASSPDSDPYVTVGEQISEGKVICMIEAMKLFNEIESDVDGEIVEILAKNGELVEYGQPLFGIRQK